MISLWCRNSFVFQSFPELYMYNANRSFVFALEVCRILSLARGLIVQWICHSPWIFNFDIFCHIIV